MKEISERLAVKYDVEVICADLSDGVCSEIEEINGVKVKRFRSISTKNAYFFAPQIFSYLKESDFDIIHAHNYHAFPALFASLAKDKKNFIFTPHYHGVGSTSFRTFLHIPYKFIGSKILNRAEKIICVSNYERDLVIKNFGREENIFVIPNGINLKEIRKVKPFEFDRNLILYLGRLEKYKNIHLVIKAMKYLPDDFLYIGGPGSYERELRILIRKLGLDDRVRLLGFVSEEEKYRWMNTCSLFINLSSIEAFGMNVLEALAAGKPVIVNNEGGLKELSEKFESVFPFHVEVDEASLKKLAEMIEEIRGMEVKDYLGEYDWDNIVKRIEKVYEN